MFFITLFSGTLIRICSSSWFRIWIGLEINLLSFIPLSINLNNLFSSEASLKYFLTQALASRTLLFSIIFYSFYIEWNTTLNQNNIQHLINILFISSLIIKIGIAPFHFWFPNVIEGLNWINNLILITWQKIAPFVILSFCLNFNFLIFSIIISAFIGAIGGLNQSSLRKLIAYSSINHLRWMTAAILNNENIWKIYFLFYCILSIVIILLFNNFKITNLNQLYSFIKFKILIKFIIFIPLLSLGGLPPFLGFFPKWLVIELLISKNLIILLIIILNFTLIALYFYIRIAYTAFLINHNEIAWNFINYSNPKKRFLHSFFLFISIFGLIFINIFFLLL